MAYDVYLNYPVDHRLALLNKGHQSESSEESDDSWVVAYEAALEEDVLEEEDPTTALEDRVPTFHGYSGSGDVTGSFVYVNYGSYQDYEDLLGANITLEGRIAIARSGGVFRGLKVKRAQQLGMAGVVLYSDPGDDGEVTEANGYDTYPSGPARNPSSVERGGVAFHNNGPGDPTTPGYPSKPGAPRQPVEGSVAEIPSIPISYIDALPILKALNGHGPLAKDISEHWTTNTGLGYKGVEYNIGPSPADTVLNLRNEQKYVTTPIWNVIGIVNGTIPDEVVVVGNHRDAWVAGGAADPNSGSTVLNEAIRSLGVALERGWRPLRTIVFASWDGEEYGLIGSTEWVEEYLPWLSAANVAYVNVDVGVSGPVFRALAAPLLHRLLYDVTALVPSPNQTVEGQTVRDVWDGEIGIIGSGSDFTAFQDHAGIPSIDFGFGGANEASPVYMYHSNFDSFHWMATYGDPGFVYHKTMAQVLGLTLAQLSDAPLLALNATDYAAALHSYVQSIEDKLASMGKKEPIPIAREDSEIRARAATTTEVRGDGEDLRASLAQLYQSVEQLHSAAVQLDAKAEELAKEAAAENMPRWKLAGSSQQQLWRDIRATNSKYKDIERAFVHPGGLDGRSWFKHVVFAPGL